MSKRTRYFLAGSALVVIVGLCTGLVAYYNGSLPIGGSSTGPSELAYLPADSSAVAYANVQDIMNSQFRQRLRQLLPSGEEKDKLAAEMGIDLERDIDTVVAGFAGGEPKPDGALVLVRGRFSADTIQAKAIAHGARVEEYKGKKLVLSPANHPPAIHRDGVAKEEFSGGVAFLEPGLVALGEASSLKRAIDTGASRENVTGNAQLMKFVSEVPGGSNAWVVGKFDALAKSAAEGLPEQAKAQLSTVQWFAVSARVNGGVSGMVRAEARDEESAKNLRDAANGLLALGKMMSGQDKKLDSLVNSLQLQGVDKTVTLSFTLPPEILDVINGVAAMRQIVK
jgi:hypothetical protein